MEKIASIRIDVFCIINQFLRQIDSFDRIPTLASLFGKNMPCSVTE